MMDDLEEVVMLTHAIIVSYNQHINSTMIPTALCKKFFDNDDQYYSI
jgi:hypothetical protein